MKIKASVLVVVTALLVTACTSGRTDASGSSTGKAAGGSGVPAVMQPMQARDVVHSSMEGKRVAFVPMLYKGFKVAEEWGIQMKRSFSDLGAKFTVYDSNFDVNLLVRTVDGLVKGKQVDMLVLQNAGDLNVLNQQIRAAHAAGIYVVVVNVLSGQSPDLFVGPDGYSMAEMITRRAATDCKAKNKTDIAVIDGPETDSWSQLVNGGIKSAAGANGLKNVETTDSKWQADLANQQAATFVQRHGDSLCAIITPWDPLSIAASQAVKQAVAQGRVPNGAIGIYSLDASIDGCNAIKDGGIQATVAYDHDAIGAAAAMAAQQFFELKNAPGSRRAVVFVPHALVDKSNLERVTFACYYGES
jgi:ribose transport system substrate-binding protein